MSPIKNPPFPSPFNLSPNPKNFWWEFHKDSPCIKVFELDSKITYRELPINYISIKTKKESIKKLKHLTLLRQKWCNNALYGKYLTARPSQPLNEWEEGMNEWMTHIYLYCHFLFFFIISFIIIIHSLIIPHWQYTWALIINACLNIFSRYLPLS